MPAPAYCARESDGKGSVKNVIFNDLRNFFMLVMPISMRRHWPKGLFIRNQ